MESENAPRYACSKCGNLLPIPPPDATGWTCDVINKTTGKYCGGLPAVVRESAMRMPYLVQRMIKQDVGRGTGVDAVMRLDYMGAAEFEFGAIPAALACMRTDAASLTCVPFEASQGLAAAFVGCNEDLSHAQAWFEDQLSGARGGARQHRHKEPTYLEWVLESRKPPQPVKRGKKILSVPKTEVCAWWALDQERPWAIYLDQDLARQWLDAIKAGKPK